MFCIHCGASNPQDASFCSTCGKSVGTPANPPIPVEIPRQVPDTTERSSWNAAGQTLPQTSLPVPPPQPLAQYQPATAGKGKPVLWILGGFGACLLLVIAVVIGSRLNQASQGTSPSSAVPDTSVTPAPAGYTPPPAAPVADNTPAPASAPVQAPPSPPPAASQNPIIGDWKATTFIGSSIGLHLGADGRYILNPGSDEGVYVFSSGDGTLRLQSNSFFSKGIMIWSCQVSGDSLSCVDPDGAGHVYTRIRS
jgi:hypothetical protein